LIILSNQLRIFGLVSFYLTNYLILRELISQRSYAFGEGGGPSNLKGVTPLRGRRVNPSSFMRYFSLYLSFSLPLKGVTQEVGREEVE
jgi:hypothetical protein